MSDLLVFQEMAENDQEIMMSPHFVGAQTAKGGGHITMGVDTETLHKLALAPEKYVVALYIANKDEFFKIKDQNQ